jgi:hypothetical protein
VKHAEQRAAAARHQLMRLVSRRRDDERPAFIRSVEAELTDDQQAVMLVVVFTCASFSDLDGDPANCVGLFFDREQGEAFDATTIEAGFAPTVHLMNSGFYVKC